MQVHDDIEAFLAFYESLPGPKRLIGYSKFAERHYAQDGLYGPGTWLVFGSETSGLPTMVRAYGDAAFCREEGCCAAFRQHVHGA